MKTSHIIGVALAIASVTITPLSAQRGRPQNNQWTLQSVRSFLAEFDPGNHHFPGEVATRNGVQGVRQPSLDYCTTDPAIDALKPFASSADLTTTEQRMITMAIEGSLVCSSPFAGASNPFGRVPRGVPLTSLREALGRAVRIVDWRLADDRERAACTKAVSRQPPRFERVWTFQNAFVQTVDVLYDVGIGGRVVNVRDLMPRGAAGSNLTSTIAQAKTAAAVTTYENPFLDGAQLYCINVGERMQKMHDGNGRVTGRRDYNVRFRDQGFGF